MAKSESIVKGFTDRRDKKDMRISQLLQSEIVTERTVIEIYRKMSTADRYECVAEGYSNEYQITKFEGVEMAEFSWKSYPNVVSIFI